MRRSFAAAAIYAASAAMNRRTMHRVPISSLIVDHTYTARPAEPSAGHFGRQLWGSYPSDFGDSFWPELGHALKEVRVIGAPRLAVNREPCLPRYANCQPGAGAPF